jgi:phospholipase C
MKPSVAVLFFILAIQILTNAYSASASADQVNSITPIKHIVIIMMENHSFDNIFGTYPTTTNNTGNTSALISSIQAPDDVLKVSKGIASTLSQVPNGTFSTPNPDESAYYSDWDNGKMDGFSSNSGTQSMTYFGPSQLAIEWDWAVEYAIGDRYFSSCLCQTDPSRLYSLAGNAAGETYDYTPPPYISVNQSIFSELSRFGISWGYYLQNPYHDNYPLNYFSGIGNYSSEIQSWDDFNTELGQGTLPAVSWLMPVGGGAYGVDQHPSYNVTEGEDWLLREVNSVMLSPYWNSTAIFVNYDEGGGYYDSVPPPTVDGVQLGFRVPLFVISPYAKENYVSHTIMNHASILAFIDYNWNLPALNQFVADSAMPLDMFNFNESYPSGTQIRSPVVLSQNSGFPVNPQIPFGDLPYSREGFTAQTLSSIGASVYTRGDSNPFLLDQSLSFIITIGMLLLIGAILVVVSRRHKRR